MFLILCMKGQVKASFTKIEYKIVKKSSQKWTMNGDSEKQPMKNMWNKYCIKILIMQ